MSKQDGYASRTPADLERKYKFGETFAEVFGLASDARKIAEEAQSAIEGLDQEQIFNLLTNNGKAQGIYRDDKGDVYVNASFIQSGTLNDGVLPASIARKSELPELIGQLGYLDETGVTSIVRGVVTTDYVNALGITVSAAQIKDVLVIGEQLPDNLAVKSDIPTKTSQLTNNSGFAVTSDIPTKTSQLTNDSGFALNSAIPTALSQLVNDKGFVAESGVTSIVRGVVTTDYVNALGLKVKAANITGTLTIGQLPSTVAVTSQIPTKTSQLTNNSGFVDSNAVTTITNNAIKTAKISANQIEGGTITGCRLQTVTDDMLLAITIDENYIAFGDYASFSTRTDGGIGVLADRGVLHLYGQDGVYITTDGNTGNYWVAREWGFELRDAWGEPVGYINAERY